MCDREIKLLDDAQFGRRWNGNSSKNIEGVLVEFNHKPAPYVAPKKGKTRNNAFGLTASSLYVPRFRNPARPRFNEEADTESVRSLNSTHKSVFSRQSLTTTRVSQILSENKKSVDASQLSATITTSSKLNRFFSGKEKS